MRLDRNWLSDVHAFLSGRLASINGLIMMVEMPNKLNTNKNCQGATVNQESQRKTLPSTDCKLVRRRKDNLAVAELAGVQRRLRPQGVERVPCSSQRDVAEGPPKGLAPHVMLRQICKRGPLRDVTM